MLMVMSENGWVKAKPSRFKSDKVKIVKPVEKKEFINIEKYMKELNKNRNQVYSSAIAGAVLLTSTVATGGGGIFWDTFLKYIFPWLIDIAKVFCAIKIAQAFYQERRGGRDDGTGFGAIVSYGKWLILFHLLPWGVELIDELGNKMWEDVRSNK